MGCGLHKPHVPWDTPAEFFALFPPATSTPLPPVALQFAPVRQMLSRTAWMRGQWRMVRPCQPHGWRFSPSLLNQERMPMVAWHKPENVDFTTSFNATCDDDTARIYRQAYYASVAYQDYNIGRLLSTLDELEQTPNTVVCVFGDHGCASSSCICADEPATNYSIFLTIMSTCYAPFTHQSSPTCMHVCAGHLGEQDTWAKVLA